MRRCPLPDLPCEINACHRWGWLCSRHFTCIFKLGHRCGPWLQSVTCHEISACDFEPFYRVFGKGVPDKAFRVEVSKGYPFLGSASKKRRPWEHEPGSTLCNLLPSCSFSETLRAFGNDVLRRSSLGCSFPVPKVLFGDNKRHETHLFWHFWSRSSGQRKVAKVA